mmetsp:Transcript_73607/g.116590  ORF Transcript_73607/g.116590 Transcript_73607/m.116590 type:complete len:421 (-) Transcript_73607:72-1334(-)
MKQKFESCFVVYETDARIAPSSLMWLRWMHVIWLAMHTEITSSMKQKFETNAFKRFSAIVLETAEELTNSSSREHVSSDSCDAPHVTVSDSLLVSLRGCPCPPTIRLSHKEAEYTCNSDVHDTRHESKVHRLVVTAGQWHTGLPPTNVKVVQETLCSKGFDVYLMPSITSMLRGSECDSPGATGSLSEYELSVFQLHLKLEDLFLSRIRSRQHARGAVVIMEGVLNGKSRVSDTDWDSILKAKDLSGADLFQRYDGVLHFVDKGDSFFAADKNKDGVLDKQEMMKFNSGDQQANDATLSSWAGHTNRVIVRDRRDSLQKKETTVNAVNILFKQSSSSVNRSLATKEAAPQTTSRTAIVVAASIFFFAILCGVAVVMWCIMCGSDEAKYLKRLQQQQRQEALDDQQRLTEQMNIAGAGMSY